MSYMRTCLECHKICWFEGWNVATLLSLWSGFCPKCESHIIDKANAIDASRARASEMFECRKCKKPFFRYGLNEDGFCEICDVEAEDDDLFQ